MDKDLAKLYVRFGKSFVERVFCQISSPLLAKGKVNTGKPSLTLSSEASAARRAVCLQLVLSNTNSLTKPGGEKGKCSACLTVLWLMFDAFFPPSPHTGS